MVKVSVTTLWELFLYERKALKSVQHFFDPSVRVESLDKTRSFL